MLIQKLNPKQIRPGHEVKDHSETITEKHFINKALYLIVTIISHEQLKLHLELY